MSKAICWDMEGTLGEFSDIALEVLGDKLIPKEQILVPEKVGVRYGQRELLERLSLQGFEHFVTTSACAEYANEALRRYDLLKYFEKVFDCDAVQHLRGKKYRPVTEVMGFSDSDASSNMVVIGNNDIDQPADIEGLVFINQSHCLNYDAIVTEKILRHLLKKGNDDFKKGFDVLQKNCNTAEDIVFEAELVYDRYPVIWNIKAENYRKCLVKLTGSD